MVVGYMYLKLLQSKDMSFWDVKSYLQRDVSSKYKIEKLQNLLIEHTKKVKLFEKPDEDFKILGVNNQEGLFDAYVEKGKNINQPYKKVENGYFAYNPYRINVGSIGLKSSKQNHEYISPAYVVFSCKETLLPEYLEILFKTKYFIQAIRHNTTGAVRQTLGFDNLCNISIPLPSITEQEEIVAKYEELQNLAHQKIKQAEELENSADEYFLAALNLKDIDKPSKKNELFKIVTYKQLQGGWQTQSEEIDLDKEIMLKDACVFVKRMWSRKDRTHFNYIEINSINKNQEIEDTTLIETKKAPSRATQIVQEGDLILATTRPYLKKFAIVPQKNDNDICSSGFQILNAQKGFNIEFVRLFLSSRIGVNRLSQKMTGALYPAINTSDLKKIFIPNLPLIQQNRIVEQILKNKNQVKNLLNESVQLGQKAISNFEQEVFN